MNEPFQCTRKNVICYSWKEPQCIPIKGGFPKGEYRSGSGNYHLQSLD